MSIPKLTTINAVNTEDIADSAVTGAKILGNTVTLDKLPSSLIEGFVANAGGLGNYTHHTVAESQTLLNVEDGATANSSDATLLARANHTGTQLQATISDLPTQDAGGAVLTRTNGANVAASILAACYWHRSGSYVFVDGRVTVDPTAATAITVLGLSLPIASNIGATGDLIGTGVHHQAGGIGVEHHSAVTIYGNVAGDRAELTWYPAAAVNGILRFHFAYEILV